MKATAALKRGDAAGRDAQPAGCQRYAAFAFERQLQRSAFSCAAYRRFRQAAFAIMMTPPC